MEASIDEIICDNMSTVPSDFEDGGDTEGENKVGARRGPRVMELQSDSDGDIDVEMDWTNRFFSRVIQAFQGNSGLKVLPQDVENIEEVVSLFIGVDLFQHITIIKTKQNIKILKRPENGLIQQ